MKKQTSDTNSLKKIIVFCVLVFFLIAISLTYKTILILQAGKFDGQHRFTLRLINGKTTELLSFDPQNKTQISVMLPNTTKDALLEKILGVPIDATVVHAESINYDEQIATQMRNVLFRFPTLGSDLTIFDALALAWFANTIQGDETPLKITNLQDEQTIDTFAAKKLSDTTITQENKSVQIINATGQSGIGRRLERLVSNIGGNIVAVNTGRDVEKSTKITYFGEVSYTVKKLEKILGIRAQEVTSSSISDILVVLGSDILAKPLFR